VFLPLWDMNHLKRIRFQYVTVGLILVNFAVYFIFQMGLIYPLSTDTLVAFTVVPNELVQHALITKSVSVAPHGTVMIPESLTLITYMFLHANIAHIFGNMIFLWVFGDNVEDAMGHVRFLAFYLICGIFAGATHAIATPNSDVPMLGASGAVAGVIAAYLMLHPNVRVWVLAFFRIPLRFSAGFVLMVWVIMTIISIITDSGGGVAVWAHLGGLIAGAVLILFMRSPGVPLFDRATGLEPRT
jgi:rhomboid family protein